MRRTAFVLALVTLAAFGGACESSRNDIDEDGGGGDGTDSATDTAGTDDGCTPGEIWCVDNWVASCNATGDGWNQILDCSATGQTCSAGQCTDMSADCASAVATESYVGCDYWPVPLSNSQLARASFTFAVAVGNEGGADANINIDGGDGYTFSGVVPGGEMLLVDNIPWIEGTGVGVSSAGNASVKMLNGAYHLTSDRPVTVYQFNPLNFQGAGGAFSYTNDASLLLPSHIYRNEYLAMSRSTMKIKSMGASLSGIVAIVGVGDAPAEIEITTSANTAAGAGIPAHQAGDTFTVTLQPYEVLELASAAESGCSNQSQCEWNPAGYCCEAPREYDLTGTVIKVLSGPNPAVYSGSDCSFVPYNRWACDHLEEQMFPRETWGTKYICAGTTVENPEWPQPSLWRVLSGSDNNEIVFAPSSVHEPIVLQKGDFIEFESLADFSIEGTGRIAVAQFMVGQDYYPAHSADKGDPSMVLNVPMEQYRSDYTFLVPDTYVDNYLTVIHRVGDLPNLDGTPISGSTVAVTSEWSRTNMVVTPGIHAIASGNAFGIIVYGRAPYTSYMYPGGLDLKKVEIPTE